MSEALRKRSLKHIRICVSKNEGKIQVLRLILKFVDISGGTARIFYNEELWEKQDVVEQLEEALALQAEFEDEEWKKDPVKKWVKELAATLQKKRLNNKKM